MSTPIGSSQWMYASGEAVTQQSLKFNDDESQYLSWTPAAAGNRKTYTISLWFKRANISIAYPTLIGANVSSGRDDAIRFGGGSGGDDLYIFFDEASKALKTNRVFRDTASWYHLVLAVDTTQATDTNRVKVYINGVQETSFASATYPAQNYEGGFSRTAEHSIGKRPQGNYFDGYLSDINFIDGQALDASSFGETVDGYWKAKDYAGTYGTNGFRLSFQDDVVSEGFNAVTYRGNDVTNRISGLGFSPDLVWLKNRDAPSSNRLYNSLTYGGPYSAGASGSKFLVSNSTAAETTGTANSLISFDADGFSVHGSGNDSNDNGEGYVAWAWDAGSGSAASNTDGTITSSVKANSDYGFSIASFVGNGSTGSVGHGLNSKPELVITKDRQSAAFSWYVNTDIIDGSFDELYLNETLAKYDRGTFSFTSTTFPYFLGASNTTIAYCFHSVAGYSSIGSYTGTGATGNVVTTGFRPAFLLYKRTDAGGNDWVIMDTTRSPANPVENRLFPNLTDVESAGAGGGIDVTDTGFVINNTYANANASGGTYIYMAFADTREAAFWKDVSGQGNHWTPNNLDYRDSLIDSPANNFATLNPLMYRWISNTTTLSEGNLKTTGSSGHAYGTMNIPTSGKWYWEAYVNAGTSVGQVGLGDGILLQNNTNTDVAKYVSNGNVTVNGSDTSVATYTTGDIISVACDSDSNTVTFYKNNSSQASVSYDPSGKAVFFGNWGTTGFFVLNHGQDSTFSGNTTAGGNQDANGIGDFKYAPPSGYLALCTSNLPTPTIIDGSEHFNTVLYTGDGTNGQAITGVGHQPDLLWIKSRSGTAYHELHDSVRGAGTRLFSNATSAESTVGTVSSFDSDGFTVSRNSAYDGTNQNGVSFVGWNWKAGGTAVSNTAGSITSQVSANTDAGFSIATYTGTGANASFGHGLGVAPDMVIVKRRDSTAGWTVFHKDLTTTHILILDSTTGSFSSNQFSPDPSSSVVSVLDQPNTNASGGTYVAYSFANTEGYLKAGSYTGNGSTDGTFVYTGHKPSFLLVKSSTYSGTNWLLFDNKRDVENPVELELNANSSNQEYNNGRDVDFVSNGFKIRSGANNNLNTSGGTYIFLAIASTPFKFSPAR